LVIDRGYRAAKVAAGALLIAWGLDWLGSLQVMAQSYRGLSTQGFDNVRRASTLVLVPILLGFVVEPLLPPIPPARVRWVLEEIARAVSEAQARSDACDPREEDCIKNRPLP
jgi:hypothetical protein